MRLLLATIAALTLAGCADPARNIYENTKARNDAKRSPNERALSPAPSYDQYKKEREAD